LKGIMNYQNQWNSQIQFSSFMNENIENESEWLGALLHTLRLGAHNELKAFSIAKLSWSDTPPNLTLDFK